MQRNIKQVFSAKKSRKKKQLLIEHRKGDWKREISVGVISRRPAFYIPVALFFMLLLPKRQKTYSICCKHSQATRYLTSAVLFSQHLCLGVFSLKSYSLPLPSEIS